MLRSFFLILMWYTFTPLRLYVVLVVFDDALQVTLVVKTDDLLL